MGTSETTNLAHNRGEARSLYRESARPQVRRAWSCERCARDMIVSSTTGHVRTCPQCRLEATGGEEGEDRWFAAIHGRSAGPFTLTELVELTTSGCIDARTFLWRSGMAKWLRLRHFRVIARLVDERRPQSAPVVRHPKLRFVTSELLPIER